MALAVDEDLDNLDLTSCKDRIVQLQADRERRLEATERLQEKLKALNNELAARRLEADQRKIELKDEQSRNKRRAEVKQDMGDVALAENRIEEDRQKVRDFTETMMQEKAAGPKNKEKKLSNYGFRIFDETELMVEKPMAKDGKEQPVDTVLVTHQKPNSDDVRYHLSYRVAKDTPSRKLREDACNYWGLSEVEYILLTVEHSKVHNDVPLQHCFKPNECCQLILAPKDPRRKVLTDKELEATGQKTGKKKKDKQVKASPEDASKRMNAAPNFIEWMQGKPGVWDFMMQRDRNVVDHLERMKLRSICIYAIFLILSMVVISYVKPSNQGYYMRQGPVRAMTSPVVDATGDMAPAFEDIKTQEDAWKWLTYVVSSQLMSDTSELRVHNYLVGWLRIRMQQVKSSSHATCAPQDESPAGLYCVDAIYGGANAGSEDLDFLKLYWNGYNATTTTTYTTTTEIPPVIPGQQGSSGRRLFLEPALQGLDEPTPFFNADDEADSGRVFDGTAAVDSEELEPGEEARRLGVYGMASWTQGYDYTEDVGMVKGLDGRSNTVNPWKWLHQEANSGDHAVSALTGSWQRYDPSGYNLDYDLQYSNLTGLQDAYRADMFALRERGWFTNRTRSIIVSFVLYSSSYDMWAQSDFVLEMPVSTVVVPSMHIDVFRPSYKNAEHAQVTFYLDIIRLVLAFFILIIQVWCEVSYCKTREESIWSGYLLTPLGLCDIAIGLLMIFIFVVRQIIMGMVEDPKVFLTTLILDDSPFQSNSSKAWLYRIQLAAEGPLFCCLLFRLMSFLRINRNIFILWTTLVEAVKIYFPLCLGLLPMALGLVVWAHALWHDSLRNFSNLPEALMSIVMAAHGDIDVDAMFHGHRSDRVLFGVVFFVMVWLILINGWIAVLVHVYQTVRVRAGYRPSDYAWKEKHYVAWALWRPLANCYFTRIRPRIDRPKWATGDVDDDD